MALYSHTYEEYGEKTIHLVLYKKGDLNSVPGKRERILK